MGLLLSRLPPIGCRKYVVFVIDQEMNLDCYHAIETILSKIDLFYNQIRKDDHLYSLYKTTIESKDQDLILHEKNENWIFTYLMIQQYTESLFPLFQEIKLTDQELFLLKSVCQFIKPLYTMCLQINQVHCSSIVFITQYMVDGLYQCKQVASHYENSILFSVMTQSIKDLQLYVDYNKMIIPCSLFLNPLLKDCQLDCFFDMQEQYVIVLFPVMNSLSDLLLLWYKQSMEKRKRKLKRIEEVKRRKQANQWKNPKTTIVSLEENKRMKNHENHERKRKKQEELTNLSTIPPLYENKLIIPSSLVYPNADYLYMNSNCLYENMIFPNMDVNYSYPSDTDQFSIDFLDSDHSYDSGYSCMSKENEEFLSEIPQTNVLEMSQKDQSPFALNYTTLLEKDIKDILLPSSLFSMTSPESCSFESKDSSQEIHTLLNEMIEKVIENRGEKSTDLVSMKREICSSIQSYKKSDSKNSQISYPQWWIQHLSDYNELSFFALDLFSIPSCCCNLHFLDSLLRGHKMPLYSIHAVPFFEIYKSISEFCIESHLKSNPYSYFYNELFNQYMSSFQYYFIHPLYEEEFKESKSPVQIPKPLSKKECIALKEEWLKRVS